MDIAVAAASSVCVIASFYVWPCERRFAYYAVTNLPRAAFDDHVYIDRNARATVLRRACSLFAVAACCVAFMRLHGDDAKLRTLQGQTRGTTSRMSQWTTSNDTRVACSELFCCTAATLLLFLGPIAERCVRDSCKLRCGRVAGELTLLLHQRVRDFVVAPFVEELFFRHVISSLLRSRSHLQQVVLGAWLFALSHAHHIFSATVQLYRCYASPTGNAADASVGACWRVATVNVLLSCVCAFVFGVLAGVYRLRFRHCPLLATSVAHALCNALGPPTFSFATSRAMSRSCRVCFALLYGAGVTAWLLIVFVAC